MKLEFLDKFFKNTQTLNFMKMHPVGAELFNTDRWETDTTKLIVAFRKFANASNIHHSPFFGFVPMC